MRLIVALVVSVASTSTFAICQMPKVDKDKYLEVGCLDKGFAKDSLSQVKIRRDGIDLYGYVDKDGKEVIPPQFLSSLFGFRDGLATATPLTGSTGYINRKGEFVIPPIYHVASFFHQGRAYVTRQEDDEKYAYINTQGHQITDFKYSYAGTFEHDHALVGVSDKENHDFELSDETIGWTVIDLEGREAFSPKQGIFPLSVNEDGIIFQSQHRTGKFGFINYQGKVIAEPIYDHIINGHNGLIILAKDDKYGLISETGKVIFPIEYDLIMDADNDRILLEQDKKRGFANLQGEIVIALQYDAADYFNKGSAIVEKEGKYGTISPTGDTIIPLQYDYMQSFSDDLYQARKGGNVDGLYALVDHSGQAKTDFIYQTIIGWDNFPIYQKDDKWGVMNAQGKQVTPALYDDYIGTVSVTDNILTVVKDDKIGFIDSRGKVVVPIEYDKPDFNLDYSSLDYSERNNDIQISMSNYYRFEGGLASVFREGKWGVVNSQAKLIVPCIYDRIQMTSFGNFTATKDATTYTINRLGKIIGEDK